MAEAHSSTVKCCTKCGESKPRTGFSERKTAYDGLHPWCLSCKRAAAREYRNRHAEKYRERSAAWDKANPERRKEIRRQNYEQNKEKVAAQSAAWRAANSDRVRETSRAYHYATLEYQRERKAKYQAENLEAIRERSREYRKANAEAINARSRQWAKDNADRHRAHRARRRAQELLATPAWASQDAMLAIYAEARRIEKETGEKMHVDHIVPLQHPLVCGLHCESNLQILDEFSNRSKGNRHWPDMP